MFSGGLDSTTALYYLLKNTNANIYVHHVIMDTSTGKHIEELTTCKKMIQEFKKLEILNLVHLNIHILQIMLIEKLMQVDKMI